MAVSRPAPVRRRQLARAALVVCGVAALAAITGWLSLEATVSRNPSAAARAEGSLARRDEASSGESAHQALPAPDSTPPPPAPEQQQEEKEEAPYEDEWGCNGTAPGHGGAARERLFLRASSRSGGGGGARPVLAAGAARLPREACPPPGGGKALAQCPTRPPARCDDARVRALAARLHEGGAKGAAGLTADEALALVRGSGAFREDCSARFAYVTYGNNERYMMDALVLFRTHRLLRSPADMVLLAFTDDKTDVAGLEALEARWRPVFEELQVTMVVTELPVLRKDVPDAYLQILDQKAKKFPGPWSQFLKIRAWQLLAYDRVVSQDSDELAVKSMDSLFYADDWFAYSDGPFSPLNSGIMSLRPDLVVYEELLGLVKQGKYTNEHGWNGWGFVRTPERLQRTMHAGVQEQGLFWAYHASPKQLEVHRRVGRKVHKLDRGYWNWSGYYGRPPEGRAGHIMVHFPGCGKPSEYLERPFPFPKNVHPDCHYYADVFDQHWDAIVRMNGGEPVVFRCEAHARLRAAFQA